MNHTQEKIFKKKYKAITPIVNAIVLYVINFLVQTDRQIDKR